MRNLYLIGFMGAGKTLVGRAVARLTGRVFSDLDEAIEERLGISVPEIFSVHGEAEFRRIEHQELGRTTSGSNLVVATGGGAFSSMDNRQMIRDSDGLSVFLDPPWSLIESRLEREIDGRPKWVNPDQAKRLYQGRLADYRKAAIRITINGEETADEIAGRIESAVLEIACVS